jgi:hypothetical protein
VNEHGDLVRVNVVILPAGGPHPSCSP